MQSSVSHSWEMNNGLWECWKCKQTMKNYNPGSNRLRRIKCDPQKIDQKEAHRRCVEKFMNNISPEPLTGCWLWTAASDQDGYGLGNMLGKHNIKMHRWSFETFVRPIPKEFLICHKCDTPACVNPAHLFIGTNSDNQKDSFKKGRKGKHIGARGALNPIAKLTVKEVGLIREAYASGVQQWVIAEKYKVTQSTVSNIITNRTWAEENKLCKTLE